MIALAILIHALVVLVVGEEIKKTIQQPKHWKPTIFWEN
jgi:hypothetical protein